MRIDLTLVAADGTSRDVAVVCSAGATWAEVEAVLRAAGPFDPLAWAGRERLRADARLGVAPLVSGAVLTAQRPPARRNGEHLAVVGGLDAGREIPLTGEEIVVGRDPVCALAFADPSMSRRHAAFRQDGRALVVRDLGSTHGTQVDGGPVHAPTVVPEGALVRLGDTYLAVARDVPAPAPAVEVVLTAPSTAPSARRPRVQVLGALVPALAGGALAVALHSPMFLVFAALTPVTLLAGAGGDRWQWRRERRRAGVRDRRELEVFARRVALACAADAAHRLATDPDPATIVRIATRARSRLWERAGGVSRALGVRVGLASLPTRVLVERDGRTAPADSRATAPVIVDLRAGPVLVIAPRAVRDAAARAMVTFLATLHPPAEVELAVVSSDPARWAWMRWLPHWHGVSTAVELARHARAPQACLVVVVDDDRLDLQSLSGEDGVAAIVLRGRSPHPFAAGWQRVVDDGVGASARVERSTGDEVVVDVVLDGIDATRAETVARALAPLRDAPGRSTPAPRDCALVDVLGLDTRDPVSDIRARWSPAAGGLRTALGRTAAGDPVEVDLVDDGPHVLIAGTTGSGKSQLLQSLVAGLAVQHPPDRVTFLLVDYKGGAAFASCTALPHTVGVVTDLDEHLTRRVLTSLGSEITRRERVLAAAAAADLDALPDGSDRLPRLVIVVDEFATLADELPGFVAGLVSVAQRGRSLGLHLVLATQRPAGVVSPEIRANTALRICLRVTDAADSADVLGTGEAATIGRDTPGRGYLRRGGELVGFQAAHVSSARSWRASAPRVLELDGWRRPAAETPRRDRTDLHRLVDALVRAGSGLPTPRRPWVDVLPHAFGSDDLPPHGEGDALVVGEVDVPERQCRERLEVAACDTVLLAGRARSGRTTALRTMATAFAEQRSPARAQLYVVDAVGSELRALADLPHAATIACSDDGFAVTALLVERLVALFATRRATRDSSCELLVLVDGWEQLVSASEAYDGGRTADGVLDLMRDAAAAHAAVVVTGGRAALAARIASHAATRLLLALPDPSDYLLAGVERAAVPAARPGRGVRADDSCEFQIALPRMTIRTWAVAPAASAIRIRPLPERVALERLARPERGVLLGVGGEGADVVAVDLFAGSGRLLVAGPAGSGRSTALRTLLTGVLAVDSGRPVLVVAPSRSPLAIDAHRHGVPVAAPDSVRRPREGCVVIVDDIEVLADTPAVAAIGAWADDDPTAVLVVAARSDLLALTFRGLATTVQAARCGVLLQPGPVDGELLGVSLPRTRPARIAGRGVLVPDPRWSLGEAALPVQIACPS